jgi:hypothetical protein
VDEVRRVAGEIRICQIDFVLATDSVIDLSNSVEKCRIFPIPVRELLTPGLSTKQTVHILERQSGELWVSSIVAPNTSYKGVSVLYTIC